MLRWKYKPIQLDSKVKNLNIPRASVQLNRIIFAKKSSVHFSFQFLQVKKFQFQEFKNL